MQSAGKFKTTRQSGRPKKVLVIRLSSFGDIAQCCPAAALMKASWPESEIHWVIRKDMAELLAYDPNINRLWTLDRDLGFAGLWFLCWQLAWENFTHVYDAHSNLRSHVICWVLRFHSFLLLPRRLSIVRRPKNRFLRYLLFRWRLRLLPEPFIARTSFLKPLKAWGLESKDLPGPPLFHIPQSERIQAQEQLSNSSAMANSNRLIAIVPGASRSLKQWPLSHWLKLISMTPQYAYVMLGGPQDEICKQISEGAVDRVINLAGKMSLLESCAVVELCSLVIANDTGLLHVADGLGKRTIALIGPTAFGFTASPTSCVAEVKLECRPCTKDGRGGCTNPTFKRCLEDITPEAIAQLMAEMLHEPAVHNFPDQSLALNPIQ